jgi:hypothetical protein
MIDLKTWFETVDYRITEGTQYQWNCFGDKAYSLSSWNGDHDGYSFNVVFDTDTQEVYVIEACDYKNNNAYRIINPKYKNLYNTEVLNNKVDDTAWEDVKWVDLELVEDWISKSKSIRLGETYDTRVSFPIELSDSELLVLFKLAHEADMSLNNYVEKMLRKFLNITD